MADFGLLEPICLDNDQIKILEKEMADGFAILRECSGKFYKFANVKKLRDEYKSGDLDLSSEPIALLALCNLQSLEKKIIAGFIKLAKSVWNYNLDIGDCVQECALGIYDAMYTYNGSVRFSTYVTTIMKNRIISILRKENRANGINRLISKLRREINNLVKVSGVSVENAIECIVESRSIDVAVANQLRATMQYCKNLTVDFNRSRAELANDKNNDDLDSMRQAVLDADLTSLERVLLEAHLRGDKHFRARFKKINPRTNKPYTKSWLSQIFIIACSKVQAVYNSNQRKVA